MYLNKKHNLINVIRWSNLMMIFILVFVAFSSFAFGAEVGDGAGEEKETMLSLLKKGGPVMFPLGIASILALALGLERFISLNRERALPTGFLQGLGQAWNSDSTGQAAQKYCEDSAGACGHIFKAGMQWREQGHEAVSKAIEDAGSKEAEKMKPMLREAQNCHSDEDNDRQSESYYDVARKGEAIGCHAQQIAEQDKHEQGEDEREVFAAFVAHGIA